MGWGKRKKAKPFSGPDIEDLKRRSARMDSGDLFQTLEAQAASLGRLTEEYHQARADLKILYLNEIKLVSEAIYAMADILSSRQEDIVATQPTRQIGGTFKSYDMRSRY